DGYIVTAAYLTQDAFERLVVEHEHAIFPGEGGFHIGRGHVDTVADGGGLPGHQLPAGAACGYFYRTLGQRGPLNRVVRVAADIEMGAEDLHRFPVGNDDERPSAILGYLEV